MERPTSLVLQSQSYSSYKSTNTLKSLVACDPRGAVIFSSALFTGSMSDKEIVRESGLIPLLEKQIEIGYLQRGDGLMADKGFLIEDDIKSVGLQLNLPPFARSKRQMPSGDVLTTKRIAKHRVHVERAIAKIKKFKMVSDRIPNTRLGNISQIWYVVSVLSNFQPHILKQ
ncbi:putative nuclease HARBI1 [Dissostichus eleginoides]|uniref:Nuclease HARBI1 n=1 Tax=Dissostichus eleginoides TaxID=100907 RepID=A0AAD9B6U3_DISEL|nr:putative nuclease HARBI1 [Dissostichus eleginoides]